MSDLVNPELPGTERPRIKALDAATKTYLKHRDARMRKTEHEKESKEALMQVMREHADKLEKDDDGNHVYLFVDGDERRIVRFSHAENVSVRKAPEDDE